MTFSQELLRESRNYRPRLAQSLRRCNDGTQIPEEYSHREADIKTGR